MTQGEVGAPGDRSDTLSGPATSRWTRLWAWLWRRRRRAVVVVVVLVGIGLAAGAVQRHLSDAARRHMIAAAQQIEAWLDTQDPAQLEAARAELDRVSWFASDTTAPDRSLSYAIKRQVPFLKRLVRYLADPSDETGWSDLPLFSEVLRYLVEEDYRRLRIHLAGLVLKTSSILDDPLAGNPEHRPPAPEGAVSIQLIVGTVRPERWAYESEIVLPAMQLRPAERVADIGSGAGFFTTKFAEIVGPTGAVYAIEIDWEALALLDRFVARRGLTQIHTVRAHPGEIGLPEDAVDVAFLSNCFWEIDGLPDQTRRRHYESVRRALRPGGRMVTCDAEKTYGGRPFESAVASLAAEGFAYEDAFHLGSRFCLRTRLDGPAAGP